MFPQLLAKLETDIAKVDSVLSAHEALRQQVYPTGPDFTVNTIQDAPSDQGEAQGAPLHIQTLAAPNGAETLISRLRSSGPPRLDWWIFDYCAAITRLYAIFETFIENVVKEYLTLLPVMYPIYLELPQAVQLQHRIGTAQILQKWGEDSPFRHLTERSAIEGLANGLLGNAYSLLSDAFLLDPYNYRAEAVNKTFGYLGLSRFWEAVESRKILKGFIDSRDPRISAREFLKNIVEERNLAGHANVAELWSIDELVEVGTFIKVLAKAVLEVLQTGVFEIRANQNPGLVVGTVFHKFTGNLRGLKMGKGTVRIGEVVWVAQEDELTKAEVLSIEVKNVAHQAFDLIAGEDIGIMFPFPISKGALIYREGIQS